MGGSENLLFYKWLDSWADYKNIESRISPRSLLVMFEVEVELQARLARATNQNSVRTGQRHSRLTHARGQCEIEVCTPIFRAIIMLGGVL